MQFIFMRDTDGTAPSWYIANFVHRNVSAAAVKENADLLFQYTGLQYSVGAPIDKAFKCCKLECKLVHVLYQLLWRVEGK